MINKYSAFLLIHIGFSPRRKGSLVIENYCASNTTLLLVRITYCSCKVGKKRKQSLARARFNLLFPSTTFSEKEKLYLQSPRKYFKGYRFSILTETLNWDVNSDTLWITTKEYCIWRRRSLGSDYYFFFKATTMTLKTSQCKVLPWTSFYQETGQTENIPLNFWFPIKNFVWLSSAWHCPSLRTRIGKQRKLQVWKKINHRVALIFPFIPKPFKHEQPSLRTAFQPHQLPTGCCAFFSPVLERIFTVRIFSEGLQKDQAARLRFVRLQPR